MDHFKIATARRLRETQTSAEAKLWRGLRNRSLDAWKFRRQHPIDRFVVDFVTVAGKLIVEVDGATQSEPQEIAGDNERTKILESLGFRIIRVNNADIYENLVGVLDLIFSELSTTRG